MQVIIVIQQYEYELLTIIWKLGQRGSLPYLKVVEGLNETNCGLLKKVVEVKQMIKSVGSEEICYIDSMVKNNLLDATE